MNVSFKNRIAFHYMIATAIIMAFIFSAIFFIVKSTVIKNLDADLSYEAEKHTKEIKIIGDSIFFINKAELEEREHREIQVNPVFIELIDKNGNLMDKSPNLKQDFLPFKQAKFGGHFDYQINNRSVRQVQLPIIQDDVIKGYILAAMSSESAMSVILKLRNVLLISYFIVLIGLYYVSRFLAGRSIIPIQAMTKTITRITKNNLDERVALPPNHDEIYKLSSSFNDLLEHIEKALKREKQFTSDASHELRTPLASIRGTLEVLIRKPRSQEDYEDKIKFSLKQIDYMSTIIEQLLLLARIEQPSKNKQLQLVSLPIIINENLTQFTKIIKEKNLQLNVINEKDEIALVPNYYSNIIIANILNNAIKYSHNNTTIDIKIQVLNKKVICNITDNGIGIKEKDLKHIYDSFYRSDALQHKHIPGNGLGLAIVKKCVQAIKAELNITSKIGQGTTVIIKF